MREIGADLHLQLLPLWCWQVQHLQKELNPFAKKTLHFEIWSRTEDAYEIEDPWIWETNGLMKWFVIVLLEQEDKPSLTINRRVPERNMLESLLLVMINLRIIKNSMATHILYYRVWVEVFKQLKLRLTEQRTLVLLFARVYALWERNTYILLFNSALFVVSFVSGATIHPTNDNTYCRLRLGLWYLFIWISRVSPKPVSRLTQILLHVWA